MLTLPSIARWLPVGLVLALAALVYIQQSELASWTSSASNVVPMPLPAQKDVPQEPLQQTVTATTTATATITAKTKPSYTPGKADPHRNYSRAVIVASIKKENTSWIAELLPDLKSYIYVNDDPEAPLTVPKNKYNEVMTYLTFLIDHYDQLPDVMIFIHSHSHTHHNPPLLSHTGDLLKRLNSQRVVREGYMNLNCGTWESGKCTAQMRPAEGMPFGHHREAWQSLFPDYPLPQILAQFCCAQFAVSKDRVQQIPRADFQRWRQFLLDTNLDNMGYLFEYLWQFIFKGEHVYCPASAQCFCDGFGLCFGGEKKFFDYHRLEQGKRAMIDETDYIDRKERSGRAGSKNGEFTLPERDQVRRDSMKKSIGDFDYEIRRIRQEALARGKDPQLRAKELGGKWESGKYL